MGLQALRRFVSRYPGPILAAWLALAALLVAGQFAGYVPDLTELAAEGQARLLPEDAESAQAADLIRKLWPDQWYESLAVVVLHRPTMLTEADSRFAAELARSIQGDTDRPEPVLRVVGPASAPEIAERLVSPDRTMQLVLVPLSRSFVAPITQDTVDWLERRVASLAGDAPDGLEVAFSGDAVIGRAYMRDVQTSLDRAAVITVFLLLGVLLFVYRSIWLALAPLVTIGVGVVVSRAALGWLAEWGWEVSPLVELFLIVILFGCGTDFCLLISWRFGEHWNPKDPAAAMRTALRHAAEPLLTSAGTVIVGLTLMGTTRFKLFSSTGPSVALGLGLTLVACLTLMPALLILLARFRPRSFRGLTSPPSGFWDDVGRFVLARPVLAWVATLVVMVPMGALGLSTFYVQDMLTEMPGDLPAVRALRQIAGKFGPGSVAPLTVVIAADADLRESEGLALIDDLSRLLTRRKQLVEVRSATQPLGTTQPLEPARLASRLAKVDEGFVQLARGARTLQSRLNEGAAKIRTALQIKEATGIDLTGSPEETSESLLKGLGQATGGLLGLRGMPPTSSKPNPPPGGDAKAADPRELMIRDLGQAAEGAGQIAEGAETAREAIDEILSDPVGHRALDRLLITRKTVQENPELKRSFAAYISDDGKYARFDLTQAERIFSTEAMQQVRSLRSRVRDFLDEQDEVTIRGVAVTGANAESADIWALTRRDQYQTWVIVPAGVYLILLLTLRDPLACANLVITMVLTYAFALGATHLVFVTWLDAPGLDWKVPLFLFVLLVAVGVDYNIFLMSRLQAEVKALGLKSGINRAVAQTGGLISSAALITAASFASFLSSPLSSLKQLGFALVVGITVDAMLVRPVLVPCGHWLLNRQRERKRTRTLVTTPTVGSLARVPD
jgi:RND superfamily putative drug exporter